MSENAVTMSEGWEGDRVAEWLRRSANLERMLAPVSRLVLDAADPAPGESVVDVGCGSGPLTRDLATAVGPDGAVTGVDIAEGMIDAARTVAPPPNAAPIDWTVADIEDWNPGPSFDLVASRFGVMFFGSPVAAFTNLARAARPGGRLVAAVWQRRGRSPLFDTPLQAAQDVLADRGHARMAIPDDEGPSSLHSLDVVRSTLEPAGWTDIDFAPHDLDLVVATGTSEDAAAESMLSSVMRQLLAEATDDDRAAVHDAVVEVLDRHRQSDGSIVMGGGIAIVTGRSAARRARSPSSR